MCFTFIVLAFSACRKNGGGTVVLPEPVPFVPQHLIKTGMTVLQMDSIIADADAGDTVYIEPGTYTITKSPVVKPGITLSRLGNENPVFDARGMSAFLNFNFKDVGAGCTLFGITFYNMRMDIWNAPGMKVINCKFDHHKRQPNTNKGNWYRDDYLSIASDSVLVYGCTMLHRSANPGRGVWIRSGTTNARVISNTFGLNDSTGCFITAINDNSLSNTLIDSNIVNRNAGFDPGGEYTDHGIYAHSFNGLVISNNTISGWPTNGSGGAVKARNGQNLKITNNVFNHSGILLYTYVSGTAHPFLKNVLIKDNIINVDPSTPVGGIYRGIGYYRNTGDPNFTEYSMRIENNKLPYGTIGIGARPEDFNANNGGVYNNQTAPGGLILAAGINQSGNY